MIYGGVSIKAPKGHLFVQHLEKQMLWDSGIHYSIISDCFQCGFFIQKELPYQKTDFLYHDKNQEVIILISGFVYNSSDLEKELLLPEGNSVPFIILKAFNKWGPSFVNKLNGDFGIAIIKNNPSEVFLFRDHIGVQPLSYSVYENTLFFTTDTLSLCKVFNRNRPINFEPFLFFKINTNYKSTPNPLVQKVLPGHYVCFSGNEITEKKYWYPERIKIDNSISYEHVLRDLAFLVSNSVKIRSDKKLKATTHLSGGLDSGIVAALARPEYLNQKSFLGFSWAPEELEEKKEKLIEQVLIKALAKKTGITPFFIDLNIEDILKFIKNYFNNSGNFWEEKVRETLKKENCNLIFSGWGGDEFISKGNAGVDMDLLFKLQWRTFFQKNPIKNPTKLLKVFLVNIFLPLIGFSNLHNFKEIKAESRYLNKKVVKKDKLEKRFSSKYSSRRKKHLLYIKSYHLAQRCEQWVFNGLKMGIIYRFPLLDKRIIEYVLKVPSKYFAQGNYSRVFIRELSKNILPEEVRLNQNKIDWTLIKKTKSQLKELYLILVPEVFEWAKNPDLEIIDFKLLIKDIENYHKLTDEKKIDLLHRNVLFVKMLHEFTKTYRSLPEGLDNMEPGEVHDLNTDAADKNSKGPKSEV